jgi:ethanolamine-phosphate phospho-lyase
VHTVICDIEKKGRKLACFLAETILSCGGQIVPPQGYLQAVYR